MHAIIVTGGKQYKVAEGEAVFIEKLPAETGDQVVFDQVLAILDGDNAAIGTPVVSGAKVEAKVVKNGKGKKVRIFKYNPKKGYRKRQGHRQPYTKVEITKISACRSLSASSPTLGMSRVISSSPSLVSRASVSCSSMWIEVNTSSCTSFSEIRIASS